jgi:hypothetical protein
MKTEQALAEQKRVADADRRHRLVTKGPMPPGLTALQQTQFRIWSWWDNTRRRSKNKYKTRPSEGRVAPPVAATGNHEDNDYDYNYS